MIMKKIILIILVSVFGLIEINAQTVSQTILKSGTWEKIYPECNYSTTKMHFDETKMYWDVYYFYNKETITEVDTYYLSDTLPDTFDKSRVGKVNNGKYIVLLNTSMRKGKKREFMTCFEVLNVTNDELRIEVSYVPPTSIGGIGEIYVFKKVK
jgi:hypothetical protein